MANPNILKTTFDGTYPVYEIPKKFQDEQLYLTTTTVLDANGWNLDLIHALSMNGDPLIYETGNRKPDITRTALGVLRELDDQKCSLVSIASRFDGAGDVPKVHYTVLLEAGNEVIESFEIQSTRKNPVTFYTKATLKIGS